MKCVACGEEGPHFVPPSFGEEGFFTCDVPAVDGGARVGREDGYYWVRDGLEGWVIAEWDSGWASLYPAVDERGWLTCGYEIPLTTAEFEEIGERIERGRT